MWHGYESCQQLELYNCCFSSELLRRELAWTREDPLLGYLLWSGPYSAPGRGVLSFNLDQQAFAECMAHLEALAALRHRPPAHPAVGRAIRMLESDIARRWTLTALATELHLAPGYLVRLFKSATGLPPMAYLAQVRAEHAAVLLLHSDEPVTGPTTGSAQLPTASASRPRPPTCTARYKLFKEKNLRSSDLGAEGRDGLRPSLAPSPVLLAR